MRNLKSLGILFLLIIAFAQNAAGQKITSEIGKLREPFVQQSGSISDLKKRKRIYLMQTKGRDVIVNYIIERIPNLKFVDDRSRAEILIEFVAPASEPLRGFAFINTSSSKKERFELHVMNFGSHDWFELAIRLSEEFVKYYKTANRIK